MKDFFEFREAYRKPTAAEIAADKAKDRKGKDTSDRYRNMKKKVYGNMMGGLKKEESELTEGPDLMKMSKELLKHKSKGVNYEKAAAYVRAIHNNSNVNVQDKAMKGLLDLLKNMDLTDRTTITKILKDNGFKVKGGRLMRESVEEGYKSPAEAQAIEDGRKAARQGKKYSDNPHKKGSKEFTAWSKGHNQGRTTHKESVEIEERTNSVKYSRKDFENTKKGDKLEIKWGDSISSGRSATFVVAGKSASKKYNVEKLRLEPEGKKGGVKFFLRSRNGGDATFSIGDMAAMMTSIKKVS